RIWNRVYQQQHGGTDVRGNLPAAKESFGVAVYANPCAAGIARRPIILHRVRAKQICLTVCVQVDAGAGVSADLDAVEERHLATEPGEDSYRPVALDQVGIAAEPEGDLGVFLQPYATRLIAADHIGPEHR